MLMKKFTLLFLSMFCMLGAAVAQDNGDGKDDGKDDGNAAFEIKRFLKIIYIQLVSHLWIYLLGLVESVDLVTLCYGKWLMLKCILPNVIGQHLTKSV